MADVELERTFLATKDIASILPVHSVRITDIYVPFDSSHPTLRLRQNGDRFEITKKVRDEASASVQVEHTIALSEDEFIALGAGNSRLVSKDRFVTESNGNIAEIDVFRGPLAGLVLVDFEFATVDEMRAFEAPEFCLADVSERDFIAGGMLAGRSYYDIEAELADLDYQRIEVS